MIDVRGKYKSWDQVPSVVQKAVIAYDEARRQGTTDPPMSERNMISIAPMIEQALKAALTAASEQYL